MKGRSRRLAPHGQEGSLNCSRAVHMHTSITKQQVQATKHRAQAANHQAYGEQSPEKIGNRPKKQVQEKGKKGTKPTESEREERAWCNSRSKARAAFSSLEGTGALQGQGGGNKGVALVLLGKDKLPPRKTLFVLDRQAGEVRGNPKQRGERGANKRRGRGRRTSTMSVRTGSPSPETEREN